MGCQGNGGGSKRFLARCTRTEATKDTYDGEISLHEKISLDRNRSSQTWYPTWRTADAST